MRPAVIALLLLLGCGCGRRGPELYAVRGKVLLEGEPAIGALVVFHPSDEANMKERPSARVGDDGSYVVGTFAEGDGAPAGSYTVTVSMIASRTERLAPEAAKAREERFPQIYGDPATSPLKATVKQEATRLPPFELEN